MDYFLIFDGHALLYRAYHALPPLRTKKGVLVNAVYGFLLVFLKVLKEYPPQSLAVCFDTSAPTFRDEQFAEYKIHRTPTPEDLKSQLPLLKKVLEEFGVKIFEKDGYEADDLIGTLAVRFVQDSSRGTVIIVTGDQDTIQLINERVKVYTLRKGVADTVLLGPLEIREKYGFEPARMIDFKALAGDASDNIPGVPGIGEKSALSLLQKFDSIENMYHYLDTVVIARSEATRQSPIVAHRMRSPRPDAASGTRDDREAIPERLKKKLIEGKESALLSKKLATIDTKVPLEVAPPQLVYSGFDSVKAATALGELGFQSLISRLSMHENLDHGKNTSEKADVPQQGQFFFKHRQRSSSVISSKAKRSREISPLAYNEIPRRARNDSSKKNLFQLERKSYEALEKSAKKFGLLVRVYGNDQDRVLVLAAVERGFFIPFSEMQQQLAFLKKILVHSSIRKIGHDVKYDYREIQSFLGIRPYPLSFDCEIAGYVLDAGTRRYEMAGLAGKYLGVSVKDCGRVWDPIEAAREAPLLFSLVYALQKELMKRNMRSLFSSIEMPLVCILAEMELWGVLIDHGRLARIGKDLGKKIKALEKSIIHSAGSPFNVNSAKQLKKVLFEKLKLPVRGIGRTKTGISTGAAELEKLKDTHPVISLILEYRELFKLQSTYVEALPKLLQRDGRIHTTFRQTVAATGRLSSENPNLQNIPIRSDVGKKIREAFVAPKGWTLLAADYSQFELRIAASLSRDCVMMDAFQKGIDIHTKTASMIFRMPLRQVTPEARRHAKAINFGILYGLGARGLAQSTGISRAEAQTFIDSYFRTHVGMRTFLDAVVNTARARGYVETLFKRRRYLPDLRSGESYVRAAAERMAVNHPIQGTQADLMKLAMIQVDARMKKEKLDESIKMILQVHDELVFEVKNNVLPKAKKIIHEELVHVYKLRVPLEVKIGTGKSWAECHN